MNRRPGPGSMVDLRAMAESLRPMGPGPGDTPGRRWRWRRNVAIFVLNSAGFSQRWLADTFDLPRSRVAEIVKDMRARFGQGEGGG